MRERRVIHHSSNAIRRLICPLINLLIIEKTEPQSLKRKGLMGTVWSMASDAGGMHVIFAHNEPWSGWQWQAVSRWDAYSHRASLRVGVHRAERNQLMTSESQHLHFPSFHHSIFGSLSGVHSISIKSVLPDQPASFSDVTLFFPSESSSLPSWLKGGTQTETF